MRTSLLLVLLACVALSTAQYCVNSPGSCTRMRGAPSTAGNIITCVPHETRLTTDGQTRVADGVNWRHVSYNGVWGWTSTQFLLACGSTAPTSSPAVNSAECNFGPGTLYAAYSNGKNIGNIEVVMLQGKRIEKRTACAFTEMSNAARAAGLNLVLNSGFRTMEEQQYFYNCYQTKTCNNGNLAARPGFSNHQNGIAVDMSTGGGVYQWLAANAHKFGFVRTVPTEKWHWEYRPGSPRASYT